MPLSVHLPRGPVRVEADTARLEQVLSNLLLNAARYTEPNGQIELTVEVEENYGMIRVRDTGIGIPAHELPGVFDLFKRGSGLPESARRGLGLGLNLVKRLVELHGGTVAVFSEGRGKGSEFVVRLPLMPSPSGDDQPAAPAAGGGRLLRILVIEDDQDVAKSLARMLRLWGHDVRVVREGHQALEAAHEYRPEIVLIGLGLPGLDGFQVAGQIRQNPDLRHLRLIALTAFGQERHQRRALEAGFDQHLTKPVDPNALHRLLAAEQTVA